MSAAEQDWFDEGDLVAVLTTQPLDRTLDYKAPEGGCRTGAFVEVPLGPRKVLGVVWGPGLGDFDLSKIRSIIRVLNVAPLSPDMRDFLVPYKHFNSLRSCPLAKLTILHEHHIFFSICVVSSLRFKLPSFCFEKQIIHSLL